METAAPSVVVRTGSPTVGIVSQRFLALTDGWPEMAGAYYDTEATWDLILTDAANTGFTLTLNDHNTVALFTRETSHGPAAVMLERYASDYFHMTVVGSSRLAVVAMSDAFEKFLPPIPQGNDDTVPLSFWSFDPMYGGVRRSRRLPRMSWDGVKRNYPLSIRDELTALSTATSPPSGGKLMAFYGPPGNGKSTFIQSLAAEWSSWCRVDVVIDPDMLFHSAAYMNDVIMNEDHDDRWRFLIIEDGDEFLDTGAKSRVGYGVSRLLNVADGLVGKGLKLMVCITTNVNRVKFSKAMLRPGRCGAQIQFPPFTLDEAHEWCAANGITNPTFDTAAKQTVSLAELYALKGAADAAV